MIPKRLIVTHRSERALEPKLLYCIQRMRELHPEWEWCFFSDEDCERFVESEMPDYAELYRWYPRPVLKADCFRLLAVYRLGGFYLDTDFLVKSPLDPLCLHQAVFAWERRIGKKRFKVRFPDWQRTVEEPVIVANYAFGAEKGHPFVRALLDELLVRTESVEVEHASDRDVMFATGPDMVTTVYYRNRERWRDVELLGPPRSGFGFHGKHYVTGSWWQD